MPSSTLSFKHVCLLICGILAIPVVAGQLAALFYHPHDLSVASQLSPDKELMVFFGESKIRSGIATRTFEAEFKLRNRPLKVVKLDGSGWNSLHFYQLALLNAPLLRPGRDSVAIEVSATSLNESAPPDRMGVIRPSTAREIASLDGLATEIRLELLAGALAPVFRYRSPIQNVMIFPRFEKLVHPLVSAVGERGMLDDRLRADFDLVPIERDGDEIFEQWSYSRVVGDQVAFNAAVLAQQTERVRNMRVGGPKIEALTRAVRLLRARGLRVYLIQVPVDGAFAEQINASQAGKTTMQIAQELANDTGATFLNKWPVEFNNPAFYFDREHLTVAAAKQFSHVLASVIAPVPTP